MPSSATSKALKTSDNFKSFASKFESQALTYFNENGSLDGFNAKEALSHGFYSDDTWYLHVVLGGNAQIDATITSITKSTISVDYTIWDHFGAGKSDGESSLPGLPNMYWLQHNAHHFSGSRPNHLKKYIYKPFVWNIKLSKESFSIYHYLKYYE